VHCKFAFQGGKKRVQILYERNINRNITIFEINTKEKSKVLKITAYFNLGISHIGMFSVQDLQKDEVSKLTIASHPYYHHQKQ